MPASAQELDYLQEVQTRVDSIPYALLPGREEQLDDWIDVPEKEHSWVCRDYAVAKARELQAAGWSQAMLSIALCWTEPCIPPEEGDESPQAGRLYHAVLATSWPDEVWVLDSRAEDIYRATFPQLEPFAYLWAKQQIPGSTQARDASKTGLV